MPEVITQVEKLSGRDLDAAVAVRVMGWQRQPDYNYWMTFPAGETFKLHALIATWKPSENIGTAMQVVEAFIARGGRVSLRGGISELMDEDVPPGYWQAHFFRYVKERAPGTRFSFTVNAATLPEAICRAALAAIEAQQK